MSELTLKQHSKKNWDGHEIMHSSEEFRGKDTYLIPTKNTAVEPQILSLNLTPNKNHERYLVRR